MSLGRRCGWGGSLWLATALACGPDVEPVAGSGDGTADATAAGSTRAETSSQVSASDTGGFASTSAGGTTVGMPGADSTGATTTEGRLPPGIDCRAETGGIEPLIPGGCDPIWLVDSKGQAIEGAHSGLVQCYGPRDAPVVYRTGAVACPELIGDECLCDADCGRGEACICANEATTATGLGQPAANRCMPADCASPNDCDLMNCRVDVGPCLGAWFPTAFRCTSPADECHFDAACQTQGSGFCDYDELMEFFTCDPGAVCE